MSLKSRIERLENEMFGTDEPKPRKVVFCNTETERARAERTFKEENEDGQYAGIVILEAEDCSVPRNK